jgi:hypothetical protein
MTRNFLKQKSAISMLIAVIVIVIVIVAAAGAGYYLTSQNPAATASPSASPTANPTQTPASTSSPSTTSTPTVSETPENSASPSTSPSSAPDVAGASSMKYSVSATEGGETQGYTYQTKKVDSAIMMRIDYIDVDGEKTTYIVNGVQHKAWMYSDGEWEDISVAYDTWYNTWNNLHGAYLNNLVTWTGGDWTYTESGVTVRLYDISVNPSLADSLFQP